MYYKVIGFILLFPWSILAVTIAGYLHERCLRRVRAVSGPYPR
jgi:hypothetical protein